MFFVLFHTPHKSRRAHGGIDRLLALQGDGGRREPRAGTAGKIRSAESGPYESRHKGVSAARGVYRKRAHGGKQLPAVLIRGIHALRSQ